MLEQLFPDKSALARHRTGPYAEERERYLQNCAEHGAMRTALRVKANELLWLCQHLPRDAAQGIDLPTLQEIARERRSFCKGATTEKRLVDIGRPWLRFLGWWRVPTTALRFQIHLERYVTWMRDERGFNSATVVQWRSKIRDFLRAPDGGRGRGRRSSSTRAGGQVLLHLRSPGDGRVRWRITKLSIEISCFRKLFAGSLLISDSAISLPCIFQRPGVIFHSAAVGYPQALAHPSRLIQVCQCGLIIMGMDQEVGGTGERVRQALLLPHILGV